GLAQAQSSRGISEEAVPLVTIEGIVVVGEIGQVQVEAPVIVIISNGYSHAGLLAAVFVECESRRITDVFKGGLSFIAIKIIRSGIVDDQQIEQPVDVDARPRRGEAVMARLIAHAGSLRDFNEGTVFPVEEASIAGPLQSAGTAHARLATELAETFFYRAGTSRLRRVLRIELQVATDEKVDVAVAIKIAESCRGRPAAQQHSR